MRCIQTLEAKKQMPRRLNVCAYARVSVDKESMMHSLFNQVSYYSKYIQSNPKWKYVGVYSDFGKTGTRGTRGDFEEMFQDAQDGKIDLILVKSITRFARNTEITLQWVRAMKEINVDIYFESEGISILSADGEMLITLFAASAQEQSRNCSLNVLWRVKRHFEQGIPYGGKDCLGYRIVDKCYLVVPEEAEIVRRIFALYLEGNGYCKIAKILNDEGVPSKSGQIWKKNTIRTILNNYNYTGDLVLQKTYVLDYLSKLKKINYGEKDRYLVENNHEPIVSKEVFMNVKKVQKERCRGGRAKQVTRLSIHPFAGLLVCDKCGQSYKFKKVRDKGKYECLTYNDLGKDYCPSKAVPEDILIAEITKLLKLKAFSETKMRQKVRQIVVKDNNVLEVHLKDSVETIVWKDYSRRDSWTPEMREKARQRSLKKGGNGYENDYSNSTNNSSTNS